MSDVKLSLVNHTLQESKEMEKPKHFNWFKKELGYMRPGSIELPGCF